VTVWRREQAGWAGDHRPSPSVRTSPKKAEAALRPISAPTLVIWGQRDHYLGTELAEPDHDDVPNLDRVERLSDASHWVHHDEADRVNQLLIDFFGTRPTSQEPLNAGHVKDKGDGLGEPFVGRNSDKACSGAHGAVRSGGVRRPRIGRACRS
jgi:hypothetical protein